MARKDLVSEEGLRLDGRSAEDLRRWDGLVGVVSTADGSAYLSQGQTKGATESSKSSYLKPKVSVNISWNTATFSDAEQRSRPRLLNHLVKEGSSARFQAKSAPDRRIISFISAIKDCLENAIIASALPNAHIDVHVNVLSSDGSVLSCVTNAISLALMDAGLPMLDVICAVSVGLATLPSASTMTAGKAGQAQQLLAREYLPIVDISGQEELGYMLPVLTCAFLPRKNEMAFCHLESRISLSELAQMTQAAEKAASEIQIRLKEIVIKRYS
ncbi:Exosome complex component RRP41 [Mitosporidium daphniae]